MKKTTFKITSGLRSFLLVGALATASLFIPSKGSAHAIRAFAPFALVAGIKKKGITLSEDDEKGIKQLETELNAWAVEAQKSVMTPEQFEAKLNEKKADLLKGIDAKGISIGEGEHAKTLEALMRDMGSEITALKSQGGAISESMKLSIKNQLLEQKDALQQVFNTKRGAIEISIKGGNLDLDVKTAATMTTANTIDETTHSVPAALIESYSVGEFVKKRRGSQFINEIADRRTVAEVEEYKTWLEEGSEQGAFAIVTEGSVKPLTSMALVRNIAAARKVAGKYVITEEFGKFLKNAMMIIENLMADKMARDYAAILTADLNAQAASYAGTALDGTMATPTDYDAIGAVATQIESLNFAPDILILNPLDKWRIALTKDSQGRYFTPIEVMGGDGVSRVMNFRVATSTYQTAGYGTLGESGLFKIEEEPMTIRIGYGITVTTTTVSSTSVVSDVTSDFDSNRLRMILETFFVDYIATNNIGSFVKFSFATVKTALHS